ncbi:hypothetical protein IFO70_16285 [Phormidium tenue FACHB-886]|nr:hypothetical protein [Phormidium tenue FACHB-886]
MGRSNGGTRIGWSLRNFPADDGVNGLAGIAEFWENWVYEQAAAATPWMGRSLKTCVNSL